MNDQAILTFSIGPVHSFIGQARRIADLWAGSHILSLLVTVAIERLHDEGIELLFPAAPRGAIPRGLPNRFVAEVPIARASEIAGKLESAVRGRWQGMVDHAATTLASVGMDVQLAHDAKALWHDAITCSWSWVAEEGDYLHASRRGAELFAASRVYRSFRQNGDQGMKCAICGERDALPDGQRGRVTTAWADALKRAEHGPQRLTAYLRTDQTRLCLVCAAKRLHPFGDKGQTDEEATFTSFQNFQPYDDDERGLRERPYFALVTMDGDRHCGGATAPHQAAREAERPQLVLTPVSWCRPPSGTRSVS